MGTAVNYQNQLPPIPMSPLSGFLSGMNQDYANQFSNQDLSDMALQHQINQQKLDLATQLQPGQVAESQATGAKAAQDQGYYDSGAYSAARTSADAAKAAQNSATTTSANVDQSMAQAQLMAQFGQEAYGMRGRSPLDSGVQSWWSGWKQRLAPYYPNMPDHGDAGDIEQAIQTGNVATQSLMQNPAFKQKMELTKAAPEIAASAQRDVESGRVGAEKYTADQRYAGTKYTADERVRVADLANQRISKGMAIVTNIVNNANKNGWTPADVGAAEMNMTDVESGKSILQLQGTMMFQNPDALSIIHAQARKQAIEDLSVNPGYAAMRKQMVTGQGGNTSGGSPKSAIQQAVEATGEAYEPDKYQYRLAPNGKPQKAPK